VDESGTDDKTRSGPSGAKRMRREIPAAAAEQRDAADDDVPGSDDDSSSDDDDGNDDDSDVDVVSGAGNGGGGGVSPADREIQVEFEARSPQECDFYGLVHLLKQMLRPSSINISQLADRIISQRVVGSVITQSPDDNDDTDDEESDGENAANLANGGHGQGRVNGAGGNEGGGAAQAGGQAAGAGGGGGNGQQPNNDVFGVGTVLKLEHGSSDPGVGDQIVSHLLVHTSKSPKAAELRAFFSDKTKVPGFLISERILNMPPQISVPMYETLQKELRKAVAKNLPFDFTHFVMISRQFVAPEAGAGSGGSGDGAGVIFTNAEEEVFVGECDLVLDMDCSGINSSASSSPSGNAGNASNGTGSGRSFNSFTSDEFVEQRKLLVFKASKLEKITSAVKGAFPIN